jgi:pyridoxine/pyridoxamine 5'-phosphate oxidase
LSSSLPTNPCRTPHWHGYRLRPQAYEFWQEQPARLHDRLVFFTRESYGLSAAAAAARTLATQPVVSVGDGGTTS